MPRIGKPLPTPAQDVKFEHVCCHCGRTCSVTARVGAVIAFHEPQAPTIQVVNGLSDEVDAIYASARAKAKAAS